MDKYHHITCSCTDYGHEMRAGFDTEPDYFSDLSISYHLDSRRPWYNRLWLAVKYLFNRSCPYGDIGEVLLTPTEVAKLRDFCNDYLEHRENE